MFKSDASQVKKGADEARRSTTTLEKQLSGVNRTAESAGTNFLRMARAFTGLIAAGAAASIFTSNLKGAIEYGTQLSRNASLLGVNVSELDAWDNALVRTGATAGQFEGSLKSLAEHMGTSPRIALKVLPQLADTFQRLGRFRALHYGKMLGLDESTILFLQQGRREVEAVIKRQRELGLVTQQDQEVFTRFNRTMSDFDHINRSIYNRIAVSVIPVFERLIGTVKPFFEFLLRHKDVVIGALIGIGIAALTVVIPFLAANAAIVGTIALVGGLISVFALLFDDIKTYIEGGESYTGDLIKRWSEFKNVIEDIVKLFSYLPGFTGTGASLKLANGFIQAASSTPLNSQTNNSVLNGSRYQNSSVHIDSINVQTTAPSFEGAGTAVGDAIQRQIRQINDNFADGLAMP